MNYTLRSHKIKCKLNTKYHNFDDQDTKAWKTAKATRDVSNTVPSHLEPRAEVHIAGEQ